MQCIKQPRERPVALLPTAWVHGGEYGEEDAQQALEMLEVGVVEMAGWELQDEVGEGRDEAGEQREGGLRVVGAGVGVVAGGEVEQLVEDALELLGAHELHGRRSEPAEAADGDADVADGSRVVGLDQLEECADEEGEGGAVGLRCAPALADLQGHAVEELLHRLQREVARVGVLGAAQGADAVVGVLRVLGEVLPDQMGVLDDEAQARLGYVVAREVRGGLQGPGDVLVDGLEVLGLLLEQGAVVGEVGGEALERAGDDLQLRLSLGGEGDLLVEELHEEALHLQGELRERGGEHGAEVAEELQHGGAQGLGALADEEVLEQDLRHLPRVERGGGEDRVERVEAQDGADGDQGGDADGGALVAAEGVEGAGDEGEHVVDQVAAHQLDVLADELEDLLAGFGEVLAEERGADELDKVAALVVREEQGSGDAELVLSQVLETDVF